jgi:hypothetical protein
MVFSPRPATQNSTGSAAKSNVPGAGQDNQGAEDAGWNTAVKTTQSAPTGTLVKPTAVAEASSGQALPLGVRFDLARVVSPATVPARILPNAKDQIFGSNGAPNGAGVPPAEAVAIQTDWRSYLAGQRGNGNEPPSQRLANVMGVLGSSGTYALLAGIDSGEMQQFGIQDSLKVLTENGKFTADDAKALADAQADFAKSGTKFNFDTPGLQGIGNAGRLIASLPDSPNGTAVKTAYAEACITDAGNLAGEIASGKYSGHTLDQLTATLNSLAGNAANAISNAPVAAKIGLFSELHGIATQVFLKGDSNEADVLNAYAAGLLVSGSPDDNLKIAAALRGLGGVRADGTIDSNSDLGRFLQSALRGQAQFGLGGPDHLSNVTPNGDLPEGVTALLNSVAGSGDMELMAGVLHTVMQWTIQNPAQAAVLAKQDANRTVTADGRGQKIVLAQIAGTGYRAALTKLLDNSFDKFVALSPLKPDGARVTMLVSPVIADLQALTAIEMGPPFDGQIAGNFAGAFGKHTAEFAAYAIQGNYPPLDNLFKGGESPREYAATIFAQLMGAFSQGLQNSHDGFLAQAKDGKAGTEPTIQEARVLTDLLRSLGTGVLLGSAWVTGGSAIPIGLGVEATGKELLSIFGRVGLFTGSSGTFVLDKWFSDTAAQDEERVVQQLKNAMKGADAGPALMLDRIYDGWEATVKDLPGAEGDKVRAGMLMGRSYAKDPTVGADLRDFYRDYNPMG